MSVETSKQPENTSSQLRIKIGEGKRKGESHIEAQSLQDVFSDSASAFGIRKKTIQPSEIERRKMAQLGKRKGELYSFC
jgi:hypothetical protein